MQQPMQQPSRVQGMLTGTPAAAPARQDTMQQQRSLWEKAQEQERALGMIMRTPEASPQPQDQNFQSFRSQLTGQLTPQQQEVYQEASRMGGNIDPLAVAMGGPNALQQARQMQEERQVKIAQEMQTRQQSVPGQMSSLTRDYAPDNAGMQGLRQQMMSQPPRAMGMVPEMQNMGNQGDIMERLRQMLRGQA